MIRPAKSKRLIAFLAAGGLIAALAAPFAPSVAKQIDVTAAVVRELLTCRSVTADAERLACYDRSVTALDRAQKSGEIVVVDREQIKEAKKDAFGFNMPSFGKLFDRGGEKTEQTSEIELVVDHAGQGATGRWVITMTNGQVWRQIDTEELYKSPHQGSKVRIRRGMVGSFVMNIDGERSIKVHRDQ